MRIAKEDVDVRMEIPGATIRQRTDFEDDTKAAQDGGTGESE